MATTNQTRSAEIIDLARISGPLRRVLALYDAIAGGAEPPPHELVDALNELRRVGNVTGCVGRDIALLTSRNMTAPGELAVAVQRLRQIVAINPHDPASPRPRRKRSIVAVQDPLPGLFDNQGATQ